MSVGPEPAPAPYRGCPLPAVAVNPIHVDDLAHLHTQIVQGVRGVGVEATAMAADHHRGPGRFL